MRKLLVLFAVTVLIAALAVRVPTALAGLSDSGRTGRGFSALEGVKAPGPNPSLFANRSTGSGSSLLAGLGSDTGGVGYQDGDDLHFILGKGNDVNVEEIMDYQDGDDLHFILGKGNDVNVEEID